MAKRCFPVTIVLSGDVAEIAQKLADNGQLSSTLSELLRQTYGFGDEIEAKKQQLTAILDEKQRLANQEIELVALIDTLEAEMIQKKATVLPQLTRRLGLLEERRIRVQREVNQAIDMNTIRQKTQVLKNIDGLIEGCKKEMEAFQ